MAARDVQVGKWLRLVIRDVFDEVSKAHEGKFKVLHDTHTQTAEDARTCRLFEITVSHGRKKRRR